MTPHHLNCGLDAAHRPRRARRATPSNPRPVDASVDSSHVDQSADSTRSAAVRLPRRPDVSSAGESGTELAGKRLRAERPKIDAGLHQPTDHPFGTGLIENLEGQLAALLAGRTDAKHNRQTLAESHRSSVVGRCVDDRQPPVAAGESLRKTEAQLFEPGLYCRVKELKDAAEEDDTRRVDVMKLNDKRPAKGRRIRTGARIGSSSTKRALVSVSVAVGVGVRHDQPSPLSLAPTRASVRSHAHITSGSIRRVEARHRERLGCRAVRVLQPPGEYQ